MKMLSWLTVNNQGHMTDPRVLMTGLPATPMRKIMNRDRSELWSLMRMKSKVCVTIAIKSMNRITWTITYWITVQLSFIVCTASVPSTFDSLPSICLQHAIRKNINSAPDAYLHINSMKLMSTLRVSSVGKASQTWRDVSSASKISNQMTCPGLNIVKNVKK